MTRGETAKNVYLIEGLGFRLEVLNSGFRLGLGLAQAVGFRLRV